MTKEEKENNCPTYLRKGECLRKVKITRGWTYARILVILQSDRRGWLDREGARRTVSRLTLSRRLE